MVGRGGMAARLRYQRSCTNRHRRGENTLLHQQQNGAHARRTNTVQVREHVASAANPELMHSRVVVHPHIAPKQIGAMVRRPPTTPFVPYSHAPTGLDVPSELVSWVYPGILQWHFMGTTKTWCTKGATSGDHGRSICTRRRGRGPLYFPSSGSFRSSRCSPGVLVS